MLLVLLVGLVSVVLWLLLSYCREQEETHGPKLYPVVGSLFEFLGNRGRILEWVTEYLAKAPGHTITLTRPGSMAFKVTANPANVEHILKTNFENYPKGDHISAVLADLLGQGIFSADDDLWKMQRKLASYEFTTRSLRDYLMDALAQEVNQRLIPTVTSVCDKAVEVDLQDIFLRFAFDNICKLAFGVDPACLDPSFPTVKFVQAFDVATSLSACRYLEVHPLVWKVKKALNVGSERQLKEALETVDNFAASVISNRREQLKSGKNIANQDLLSRFMSTEDKQTGTLSDKFLRDMVISFVLAGRDTTSVTLAWFFWLLSKHPQVEARILDEIRELCGEQQRSTFIYDELRSMHYLQAALFETLRLYPAVPSDSKVARNSDVWPDGTRVKKGMRVTYHVYAMGRMEHLWGPDANEFKPERWIKDGQFAAESPFKFTAFQAGPRICLGKDLAVLQMKAVVAALLPRFEFLTRDGFVARYKMNMTLPMEQLPVRARPRGRT